MQFEFVRRAMLALYVLLAWSCGSRLKAWKLDSAEISDGVIIPFWRVV